MNFPPFSPKGKKTRRTEQRNRLLDNWCKRKPLCLINNRRLPLQSAVPNMCPSSWTIPRQSSSTDKAHRPNRRLQQNTFADWIKLKSLLLQSNNNSRKQSLLLRKPPNSWISLKLQFLLNQVSKKGQHTALLVAR